MSSLTPTLESIAPGKSRINEVNATVVAEIDRRFGLSNSLEDQRPFHMVEHTQAVTADTLEGFTTALGVDALYIKYLEALHNQGESLTPIETELLFLCKATEIVAKHHDIQQNTNKFAAGIKRVSYSVPQGQNEIDSAVHAIDALTACGLESSYTPTEVMFIIGCTKPNLSEYLDTSRKPHIKATMVSQPLASFAVRALQVGKIPNKDNPMGISAIDIAALEEYESNARKYLPDFDLASLRPRALLAGVSLANADLRAAASKDGYDAYIRGSKNLFGEINLGLREFGATFDESFEKATDDDKFYILQKTMGWFATQPGHLKAQQAICMQFSEALSNPIANPDAPHQRAERERFTQCKSIAEYMKTAYVNFDEYTDRTNAFYVAIRSAFEPLVIKYAQEYLKQHPESPKPVEDLIALMYDQANIESVMKRINNQDVYKIPPEIEKEMFTHLLNTVGLEIKEN